MGYRFWLRDEKTSTEQLFVSDPDGTWVASVKSNGEVQIRKRLSWVGDSEHDDVLDSDDLSSLVARLQALRDDAMRHFGDGWPNR